MTHFPVKTLVTRYARPLSFASHKHSFFVVVQILAVVLKKSLRVSIEGYIKIPIFIKMLTKSSL